MKAACVLITMAGIGALTIGVGFADDQSGQRSDAARATNDRSVDHAHDERERANDDSRQPGPITDEARTPRSDHGSLKLPKKSIGRQIRAQKEPGNIEGQRTLAFNPGQPERNKIGATDRLAITTVTAHPEELGATPVRGTPELPPSLSQTRRPAIIGQLAPWSARNSTTTLNGTGMKPRP